MKITVVGTGYVGLVSGTCFAEMGHDVMCIDVDESKIEKLKKNIIPIYEPGLEELVIRNQTEGRLNFSTDIKAGIEFAEVVFSAVGTPPDKDHRADLQYVQQVATDFGRYANEYKVFVNKSTVPVGTGDICAAIIEMEMEKRGISIDFDIASNPEFLREGCAVKDTLTPDRIVVGTRSEHAKQVMEHIYAPIVRTAAPLMFTTIESAEVIKYAANAFLATKISFINEMANFCELCGADVTEVAKGIGMDKRIGSRFLHAGIGYGGSCFPKDVQALIQTGKSSGYDFRILEAVESVNNRQKDLLYKKLLTHIPQLTGKTIGIWGLAFKPKTDDIREAPSVSLIKRIIGEGALVRVYDPVAAENGKLVLPMPQVHFSDNPYDAVDNADALLIVTEWDVFRAADLKRICQLMKGNMIIDGRNIYELNDVRQAGLNYLPIGRSMNQTGSQRKLTSRSRMSKPISAPV